MTGFYIFGFVAWLCFVIGMLALEPVHKWLVKHRWAVDKENQASEYR